MGSRKVIKKKDEVKKPTQPGNNKLFFKAWKNKVLNDAIYSRVRLINRIRRYETKFTVLQLQQHQHRSYLKKVILINDKENRPDLSDPLALPTPSPLPQRLIPWTTEFLTINNYCSINQGDIPEGVVNISFGECFRTINFPHIPKSVEKILFSSKTNVIIPDGGEGLEGYTNLNFLTLDKSSLVLLEHLAKFQKLDCLCINGSDGRNLIIHENVTTLIFGSRFNSKLPTTYSESLITLKIGIGAKRSNGLNLNSLPPNIEGLLILSGSFSYLLYDFRIFKKLKVLQFNAYKKNFQKFQDRVVSDILPCIECV